MEYLKHIILNILLTNISYGQEVKASSGGHYKTASTQVSFTIGEVLTSSYTSSIPKVTQGFHQPKITVTGGAIQMNSDIKFQIYPNPTTQQIFIEHSEAQKDFNLKIYNQLGQLIQTTPLISNKSIIEVSSFAQGNYQFIISDKSNNPKSQNTISILK